MYHSMGFISKYIPKTSFFESGLTFQTHWNNLLKQYFFNFKLYKNRMNRLFLAVYKTSSENSRIFNTRSTVAYQDPNVYELNVTKSWLGSRRNYSSGRNVYDQGFCRQRGVEWPWQTDGREIQLISRSYSSDRRQEIIRILLDLTAYRSIKLSTRWQIPS